jgi:hypothetical protein
VMQLPVNSGISGITFLFLVEATNVAVHHGLAGFRPQFRVLIECC